jgi:L-ascorbate metabolism protein UlaG (beta-lactamase superfamily)
VTRSSSEADGEHGREARLSVRFVGHATTLIDIGGTRVLTDPFLRPALGPLTRHGPLPDPRSLEADVVLISHGHPDHFDPRSIAVLPGNPVIVVPRGLGNGPGRELQLVGGRDAAVIELIAGQSVVIGRLKIRAVPARHWISPGAARAQPIGYVLDAGPRVYFAGDTGRYPQMRAVAGDADLALLPVWTWGPHLGPGHLGPRGAADVAHEIGAATVVPIHWGTLYPRHLHRVWRGPLREPGDRFAAAARQFAPEVDVRVLRPGETTTLEAPAPGTLSA